MLNDKELSMVSGGFVLGPLSHLIHSVIRKAGELIEEVEESFEGSSSVIAEESGKLTA